MSGSQFAALLHVAQIPESRIDLNQPGRRHEIHIARDHRAAGNAHRMPDRAMCGSRQSNRLAANKHRSTVPDVTAVRVISIKLPTAVETTGIGRSVGRSDFGFALLSCHGDPARRVRLPCSLTRTLPCRFVPDLSTASRACATKRLSGIVNETSPNGDGLQIYAIAFPLGGGRRFYLCTLPSQRHGTHSETCRSLVWVSAFRAKAEVARTLPSRLTLSGPQPRFSGWLPNSFSPFQHADFGHTMP